MILAISGTPGCGKTQLAKTLSKLLDFEYISITQFCKDHDLFESFDTESQTYDVDIQTLEETLRSSCDVSKNILLDSHVTHDLSVDFVDVLVVCTCELGELQKRLSQRNYSELKIRENLDAEIFQVCLLDSVENGFDPIVVNCTKKHTLKELQDLCTRIMSHKKK